MSESDAFDPVAFGAAFKKFVDNMNTTAAKEANPLVERLKGYLGDEPGRVPIVAEEFEAYEHPNVQVALDAVLARKGRKVELIGIAAQNKRSAAITFSDLLSGAGPTGRISEGSVDYINFRLEDDKVPDAEGRKRLLQLYARGLTIDGVDLDAYVERTSGASPAYIKEMLRRAALLAAIGGSATVKHEHLDTAMSELESGSDLAKRIVGFGSGAYLPPAPSVGPMRPAGFPTATVEVKPATPVTRPPA